MSEAALVVGESLVDIVRSADGTTSELPGGSGANVAVALARLGRQVRFASSWAPDPHGEVLADRCARDGVELATDPHALDRTATARATIGADAQASYTFDVAWRLNPVDVEPVPSVVHTCSLAAVLEPGAVDVRALLERLRGRTTISYDVNARPAVTGTGADLVDLVERVVAHADLVKVSDEDLDAVYGGETLVAAKRLLALGPAAVVVTRGAQGSTWLTTTQEIDVAAFPVVVADTIGAGDTFCAALVDALWTAGLLGPEGGDALRAAGRDTVVPALAQAARAASVVVGRPGADPPYRHDLEEGGR